MIHSLGRKAARRAKKAQQNNAQQKQGPKKTNAGEKIRKQMQGEDWSALREPFMHLQLFAIVGELVTFVLRPPGSRIWPQSISAFCIAATRREEQKREGGRESKTHHACLRCDEE